MSEIDRRKNWNPFRQTDDGNDMGDSPLRMFDENNPDIGLFNAIDQEIIALGGSKMTVYKYEREETASNDLYGEDRKKKIYSKKYVIGHYDPTMIQENLTEFGIQLENDQFFTFNKDYIETVLGRPLQPGDIIHPVFQNFLYEVYEVQEDRFDNYGVYHIVASAKLLRESQSLLREIEGSIGGGPEVPKPVSTVQLPTLFFDSTDVDTLRALAAGSLSTEFGRSAAGAEADFVNNRYPAANEEDAPTNGATWRNYGDRLFNAAFAAKFTDNETSAAAFSGYCNTVVSRLVDYSAWGPTEIQNPSLAGEGVYTFHNQGLAASHILTGFSVYLDLFYDQISEPLRSNMVSAMERQLSVFNDTIVSGTEDLPGSREWIKGITSNINQVFWNSVLCAGLVLHKINNSASALEFVEMARANTSRCFELRNGKGDGSDPENLFYMSYSLHALLQSVKALQQNGYEDFTSGYWLQNIYKMYMYLYTPNFYNIVGFSDQDGVVGRGPQHILSYLQQLTGDGAIGTIRDSLWANPNVSQQGNPNTGILCLDFLWKDPDIPTSSISLPDIENFTDMGVGVYKENWTSGATQTAFKSSDPAGQYAWSLWKSGNYLLDRPVISHEKADQGNFVYLPSGIRFIDGGLYERPKRTSSNNAITFLPPAPLKFKYTDAQISGVWDLSALSAFEGIEEQQQAGCWNNFLSEVEVGVDRNELIEGNVKGNLIPMTKDSSGNVFVAGEHTRWYASSISLEAGGKYRNDLQSVYRTNLKLPNDVLCIVDHIDLGTKELAPRSYFRLNSTPSDSYEISAGGGFSAIFHHDDGYDHTLFYAGPTTASALQIGRSVSDITKVPGAAPKSIDKAGGWDSVGSYSWYANYQFDFLTGMNQMVYIAVPYDKTSTVSDMTQTDNYVQFTVTTSDGTSYVVKIASKNDPEIREIVFSSPDVYYTVDYAVVPPVGGEGALQGPNGGLFKGPNDGLMLGPNG